MSLNYVKKVYFPVGVLEYISRNLLKIAVKKFNLSINFVKNKLLHNRLLILRAIQYLWNPPGVILWNLYFLVTCTSIGKMYSLLFLSLSSKNKNCLFPFHFYLFIISSYSLRVKDLKYTFETALSCNVSEVHKTILLINTACLAPILDLRGCY